MSERATLYSLSSSGTVRYLFLLNFSSKHLFGCLSKLFVVSFSLGGPVKASVMADREEGMGNRRGARCGGWDYKEYAMILTLQPTNSSTSYIAITTLEAVTITAFMHLFK